MKNFLSFPPIILASNSPRRKQLLADAGLSFEVKSKNVEEIYPSHLKREEIPVFLAELKAKAFIPELTNEILIAADTIVYINDQVVGKPTDRKDAINILQTLSNRMHEVITGVTILYSGKLLSFSQVTEVYFSPLSLASIEYYIDHYKPYDKAGSYGIQEWIGVTGIEQIKGCFYNVMGLPVNKLLKELSNLPFRK